MAGASVYWDLEDGVAYSGPIPSRSSSRAEVWPAGVCLNGEEVFRAWLSVALLLREAPEHIYMYWMKTDYSSGLSVPLFVPILAGTVVSSPSSSSSLSRSSNGNVKIAATPPKPSNLFPLSCSLLRTLTSPPSTSLTLSTSPTHLLRVPTSCALKSELEINNTPPPLPTAPFSTAFSTSFGPYHALPSSFRSDVMKSSMSRVSRAYFVSFRRTSTSGDLRTSFNEWRWPDDEWTTIKLDLLASRDLFPVEVAVSMMYFWKEAAVKPGDASKTGLDSERSIWRRRVSNVVWKNFSNPYSPGQSALQSSCIPDLTLYSYLIMISSPPLPLPRNRRLDPLPQHRLMLRNKANIRQTLLHHHGHRICRLLRIDRFPHHVERNTIPPLRLLERKVPLQFEVERVELPDFRKLVLLRYLARDMELAGLRVEVDGSDAD